MAPLRGALGETREMPRSILWALIYCCGNGRLGLAFAGTPENNSERVKKPATDGAALIASEGIEKACKMLRVRNGPYFQGEYYVFVFDFTGVWRCYPPH